MSTEKISVKGVQKIVSMLEKLTESTFLILTLSFFFYIDIFFIRFGIDPTVMNLKQGYDAISDAKPFSIVVFVLSYSLLMACFFPVSRLIIASIYSSIIERASYQERTIEEKRFSNFSFAFVVLSTYDWVIGALVQTQKYKGLAMYFINSMSLDSMASGMISISMISFWVFCLLISLEMN